MSRLRLFPIIVVLLLGGCAPVGPKSVERDRVEYSTSIIESWKKQLLLNIVKLRYVEPIFFMEVGEVVASYSLATGANVGASREMHDMSPADTYTLLELGGSAVFTDRPTVTYRPLTGKSFFRGIMLSMPLVNVLASIESGSSVKFIFNLGLCSINGYRNESLTAEGFRAADPEFVRAVALLSDLQKENGLHVIRETDRDGETSMYLKLAAPNENRIVEAGRRELQQLLRLDPKRDTYRVDCGTLPPGRDTITLKTFSLAQMLSTVSARMEAPRGDVEAGRAVPGRTSQDRKGIFDRVMVHSAKDRPETAYAEVKYRDHWFWVDDQDLVTKRVFTFIMLSFTLMDKEGKDAQLQLTVPTH